MTTRMLQGRVPRELEAAARAAAPELADAPVSVVLRAGLAALAGLPVPDAIRSARGGPYRTAPLRETFDPAGTAA
jgi:hypothetical protein